MTKTKTSKFLVGFSMIILLFLITLIGVSGQAFADTASRDNVVSKSTTGEKLIKFLSTTNSLQAKFFHEQLSSSGEILRFEGNFFFRRPDKLKWLIEKPFPQLQLLRGNEFMIYDPDLEQVTTRIFDQSLESTPAGLLFVSGPLAGDRLRKRYKLYSAPSKSGLNWVLAVPKDDDGDSLNLEIGLNNDGAIAEILTTDIFKRSSRIKFMNLRQNEKIRDSVFIPVIPPGVEYIEQ